MRTRMLDLEPQPAGPAIFTASVTPAIDELVTRYLRRDIVAAAEVVDMLLDLRLVAAADDVVAARVCETASA